MSDLLDGISGSPVDLVQYGSQTPGEGIGGSSESGGGDEGGSGPAAIVDLGNPPPQTPGLYTQDGVLAAPPPEENVDAGTDDGAGTGDTGGSSDAADPGDAGGTGDATGTGETGGVGDATDSGGTGGTGDVTGTGDTGGTGDATGTGETGDVGDPGDAGGTGDATVTGETGGSGDATDVGGSDGTDDTAGSDNTVDAGDTTGIDDAGAPTDLGETGDLAESGGTGGATNSGGAGGSGTSGTATGSTSTIDGSSGSSNTQSSSRRHSRTARPTVVPSESDAATAIAEGVEQAATSSGSKPTLEATKDRSANSESGASQIASRQASLKLSSPSVLDKATNNALRTGFALASYQTAAAFRNALPAGDGAKSSLAWTPDLQPVGNATRNPWVPVRKTAKSQTGAIASDPYKNSAYTTNAEDQRSRSSGLLAKNSLAPDLSDPVSGARKKSALGMGAIPSGATAAGNTASRNAPLEGPLKSALQAYVKPIQDPSLPRVWL